MPIVILRYWKNSIYGPRLSLETPQEYFSYYPALYKDMFFSKDECISDPCQQEFHLEVDRHAIKHINRFIARFKLDLRQNMLDANEKNNSLAILFMLRLSKLFTRRIYEDIFSYNRLEGLPEVMRHSQSFLEIEGYRSFTSDCYKEIKPRLTPEYILNLCRPVVIKTIENKAPITNRNLTPVLINFIKIYRALRDGQSGLYKTNFLKEVENLNHTQFLAKIDDHIRKHPTGRAHKAWILANKYPNNCTGDNHELFKELYDFSFAASGLFKQSNFLGQEFFFSSDVKKNLCRITANRIKNIDLFSDCRSAKILRALK